MQEDYKIENRVVRSPESYRSISTSRKSMFPPVKGSISGLNSPAGVFSKNSLHISEDPFVKRTIEHKKSKAQQMKELTRTAEGKDRILQEIHSMRLKIFEDQILDTSEDKKIKPYLPLLDTDEKNKIMERFKQSKL